MNNKIPNINKPLKICHGFPYKPEMTIPQKLAVVCHKLNEYKTKGFGGIVTNVSFNNYLIDSEEWQIFRCVLQTCREMGLRVWIYDEKGYPSGTAGGITLDGHLEWQAQAVAMDCVTVAANECVIIPLPKGHTCFMAAYAYKVDSIADINDESIYRTYDVKNTVDSISVANDSHSVLTVAYFCKKPMYEGTHAIHNVHESRRYIDVSNRDAVAAFIDNTYKPYEIYSKGCTEPEAFFTDEPSYMGAYINLGLFPESIKDEFDESMPMLPSVNWGTDVENRFSSMFGYDVIDNLTYLFTCKSDKAKKVRYDFYTIMSKLYEDSFFVQISDYCAGIGIPFSGHLLLEDDIRYHVPFEGNFFSLLRHMHIPGIDMLNGTPEKTRADAFTPKLVSSIAHTYNRPHVMSEISAHAQGGKVTMDEMLGCVITQYALGVDVFTSYFHEDALSVENYNVWNDTIGRIDNIIGAGKHIADIAVYYPIETMQANYIPVSDNYFNGFKEMPEMSACWFKLRDIYESLMNNQLDFDFLDTYVISRSEVNFSNEKYKTLLLPPCYVTDELEAAVTKLCNNGVAVYTLYDEMFAECLGKLENCGVTIFNDVNSLINSVRAVTSPVIKFADYTPDVLYLCRENDNGRSILLVNTSTNTIDITAIVYSMGNKVSVYNPRSDTVLGEYNSTNVEVMLNAYEAVVICT